MPSSLRITIARQRFCGVCMLGRRVILLSLVWAVGCSVSDVLNVPPPAGLQTAEGIKNQAGAEATFAAAKSDLFKAYVTSGELVEFVALFSDELHASTLATGGGTIAYVDSRQTVYTNSSYGEPTDGLFQKLLNAHSELFVARDGLVAYEDSQGQNKIGEDYALAGYAELALAENFCPGVVLDRSLSSGGVEYGMPLTTDSLLSIAETNFDSALAHANGDTTVTAFARVGLGRARLGRGHFADAATAVAGVPTQFVYWMDSPSATGNGGIANFYTQIEGSSSGASITMMDREGGNGLPFVSAHDSRLLVDSTSHMTVDQKRAFAGAAKFYWPTKYSTPSTRVALATGVEARLIEAEAALNTNDVTTWASKLNALRDSAASTYLQAAAVPHLTTDSTLTASTTMQQDVMFRERAFWTFGTGMRLGDLRRLVRQYHRGAETVFPTGPYPNGTATTLYAPIPNYGTDVSFTLPTAASGVLITNPHYQGCLSTGA
jgi:hypothetical protein